MKSARSKACDISAVVKRKVWGRDRFRCIICKTNQAMPNAHYIPRSKGGLGIEQNIITLCQRCHHDYDHTTSRSSLKEQIKQYLISIYGSEWSEDNLIYKKYKEI